MSSVPATPKTSVAPLNVARRAPASGAKRAPQLLLTFLWLLPALAIASETVNPLPTIAAVVSFALIFNLMWRPGLPPVLLLACLMQWLQGALLVLHADILGVEMWTLTYAHHIEEATYLTLGWVSMLAFGAFLVHRRIDPVEAASVASGNFSYRRLLIVYGVWTAVLPALAAAAPAQARQVIEGLEALRWAFAYAIFAQGWSMPRGRLLVLGIVSFEVAVGFLSFFSDFKTPLFLLAIMLVSSGYRPTLRQYLALSVVFVATLYLAIVWSSIKMDYRDQLSGGRGNNSQAIVVSTEDQIDSFVGLIGTLDAGMLEKGAQALVQRIAYVDLFAYVLDYVPKVRRHEDGRIWFNAFTHVLVPRVLFSDKPSLTSDTKIAERYTGMLLTTGRATSISIGLPAETYVDIGAVAMFIVPFVLGLWCGTVYRYFLRKRDAGALAQGLAVALHVSLTSIEPAAAKLLGGYLSALIIALVFFRLGWPTLARFLRAKPRA